MKKLLEAVGSEERREIRSVADQLIDEGFQRGLHEGILMGLHHYRNMLLKQLALRFGALPDAAVTRVNDAGCNELERWGERVLTAPTLAETLGDV